MDGAIKKGSVEKFADAQENTVPIMKSTTALGTKLLPIVSELIKQRFS